MIFSVIIKQQAAVAMVIISLNAPGPLVVVFGIFFFDTFIHSLQALYLRAIGFNFL